MHQALHRSIMCETGEIECARADFLRGFDDPRKKRSPDTLPAPTLLDTEGEHRTSATSLFHFRLRGASLFYFPPAACLLWPSVLLSNKLATAD